jgi:hypothetical protein
MAVLQQDIGCGLLFGGGYGKYEGMYISHKAETYITNNEERPNLMKIHSLLKPPAEPASPAYKRRGRRI